jgi:antitoxin (DNA-binding transcriptional repressor) of toxin-antitoxin stability system
VVLRNISQARAELSALIESLQKGNEVIIAKAGKLVARLVPFRGPARPRTPGSMKGEIWIAPNFDGLPRRLCGGVRDKGTAELRILLDTHLLHSWLEDNPQLAKRARQMISDRESTVFVSAVALWET